MQLAIAIRRILRHKLLLVLGVLVAAGAAFLVMHQPLLKSSTASTQVLVDTQSSSLVNSNGNVEELLNVAMALANYGTTDAVLDSIGGQVGLSGSQLSAAGPTSADVPRAVVEPSAPERNVQITGETDPYRLEFDADPSLPEIAIYTTAPTTPMAIKLANASVVALKQQVTELQTTGKIPSQYRIVLRPLGAATGAPDTAGARKSLAAFAFLGVFILWCILILVGERVVFAWRASAGVVRSGKRRSELAAPAGEAEFDGYGSLVANGHLTVANGEIQTWHYAQVHRAALPKRAGRSSTSATRESGAPPAERQAAN